jgi:RNA polymerase sigma-70 factor, ECF subfamily
VISERRQCARASSRRRKSHWPLTRRRVRCVHLPRGLRGVQRQRPRARVLSHDRLTARDRWDGFINLDSPSSTSKPEAARPPPGHWDWRQLTALALREASRYLNRDEAHDAAQEAAIRAWRRADTCSGAPEPWLRTIARNEALRVAQRRRLEQLPDEYDSWDQSSDEPSYERGELFAALATLSETEKQAILLRYWSDKTDAQISAMLSIPVGTVKIRLHRAREKLAQALSDVAEPHGQHG